MTENVSPLAVFLAGIVSFLSPCVLPLVPGYVSLISGTTVEELQNDKGGLFSSLTGRVMRNSLMFILGFSIVFIALGAVATTVGQYLRQYFSYIVPVAGLIIIVFGLHLTGLIQIKALLADKRMHNVKGGSGAFGAFVIGFAFAFGWTPCIGPILAVILGFASTQDQVAKGIMLLAVYSLGLAVPFLLTSLGVERFMGFYRNFRRHLHKVEVASGVVLMFVGVLIMTSKFTLLSNWLAKLPIFHAIIEKS